GVTEEVRLRIVMMSQSASAPEKMRMKVKLTASMPVSFSAARQRSELLAKAIIANRVRKKIRALMWKSSTDFADLHRLQNLNLRKLGRRESAEVKIGAPSAVTLLNRQSAQNLRTRRRPGARGLWRGRHFFYSFLDRLKAGK